MTDASPPDRALDTQSLRQAMAALEGQRGLLGDRVTELALAPLRALLAQHASDAASGSPPQLRRAQVSVLFADIVGSTALASRLDAEDVLQIFGRVLERAAACVRARGGRVLRYTGDGLKAGFGTQGTREDDAAQAVQAGLDILAAAREHAHWVAREHGVADFALRVGVHTGEVALGAGFEADNTLTGDTVNIAARMEQAAPAGGLRISADTWAHVRGLFEVTVEAPLLVKGVEAPLQTCLVLGPRQDATRRSTRGIDGLATPMVGREAELAALQGACDRLGQQRRLAAITVVAEAGMGKSRLLDEFEAWRRTRHAGLRVLQGRTSPQTEGQVFGLLRDILARQLQIADDDTRAAAQRKLEDGVAPLFLADLGPDMAQAQAHLLGHLIGIDWRDSRHVRGIQDDARQLRQRGLLAAVQWLQRLAAQGDKPLLLLLEDLHWADADSLDFLDQLTAASPGAPLLLLASTRPTLFERRAGWGGSGGPHQRLDLRPLDTGHSQHLAAALLRRLPAVPPALATLLTQQADGNPFYMEELVKVLIDRGAIETGAHWRVNEAKLALGKLPTTLTGVLQARLDSLPADERRALQQASVIGPVFWEQALAAIDAEAGAQLPALVRRGLVHPLDEEPAADGPRAYAFHHHLLQQATYSTVLKQHRRSGHGRVAHWLAGLAAQGSLRAGDFLGTAADHFELAGDTANAIEFHTQAAEHAAPRQAHAPLLRHVGRALAALGEPQAAQAALRWRLLCLRERSFHVLARRDEQLADLAALDQAADWLDDDSLRAEAAWRRGFLAMRIFDTAGLEAAARRGMACATRAGDAAKRLKSMQLLACALIQQGQPEAARSVAQEGLAGAQARGLRGIEAAMLNMLSYAAAVRRDSVAVIELTQRGLAIHESMGDPLNAANMMGNLGLGWLGLGALDQARQVLTTAVQMLRSVGDRAIECLALDQLALLALWQDDPHRAQAVATEALALADATQARAIRVQILRRLAEAAQALGRLDEAAQHFAASQAEAQAIGLNNAPDAAAGLARVALARGQGAAAVAALQPVMDEVAAGGSLDNTDEPQRIALTCHQALAQAGHPGAAAWLARAQRSLDEQAAAISDPDLREGFLANIPHHREITAAAARQVPHTAAP